VSAEWLPRRWVRYNKHRPPPHVEWEQLVAKGEISYYHPSISEENQEALEIECTTTGVLIAERNGKRKYWMKCSGIIGAADGEETDYLYAEWVMSGEVHGRPITEKMLRKMGATP